MRATLKIKIKIADYVWEDDEIKCENIEEKKDYRVT